MAHQGISAAWVLAIAGVLSGCGGSEPSGPAAAVSSYQVVVEESDADASFSKQLEVSCPDGTRALGGGFAIVDMTGAYLPGGHVWTSEPAFDGKSWLVNADRAPTPPPLDKWKLRVRVICAAAVEAP
jgi:hypothetical protein